jgi:Vanillate O-demethylase oxygenase C-terminal domain
MGAPSSEPMWCSLTSQAVTPIFERQTVYYYSGCLSRDYATEEQSKQQIAVFEKAFAEDKAMIEAQHRVVERTPERRMMVRSTDGALNQFRRLMAGLIEAEQTLCRGPRNGDLHERQPAPAAEPKVRIQVPPAASQQRTRCGTPHAIVAGGGSRGTS